MKRLVLALTAVATLGLTACSSDANVASRNLSKAADNFEINRRIVFFNGITDTYLLSIEGLCSFEVESSQKVAVTCKVAPGQFKKHTLGLSDNVSFISEQLEPLPAGTSHYVVNFKPSAILPDVRIR